MEGKRGGARGLAVCLGTVVVLTCTAESSCGGGAACLPTSTAARDASSIDLSRPDNSSVLTARLSQGNLGVVGRTLIFRLHSSDSSRDIGSVVTGGDGTAQIDLKNQPREMVAAMVSAKSWEAIWAGDATYCSSSGSGSFHLVRTP